MKTKTLGIIVIVMGIIMITYSGVNYVTAEKIVVLGPLQINKVENHPVQWSPLVGIILLVAGVLIIVGNKKGIV